MTGDPSVAVTFHGLHPESIAAGLERNPGIVATATHCVSAIPYVCRAEPGIRTYLDLPAGGGPCGAPPAAAGRGSEPDASWNASMSRAAWPSSPAPAGGIGRGIALGLAEAGADVVCAARTQDDIEQTATAIRVARTARPWPSAAT